MYRIVTRSLSTLGRSLLPGESHAESPPAALCSGSSALLKRTFRLSLIPELQLVFVVDCFRLATAHVASSPTAREHALRPFSTATKRLLSPRINPSQQQHESFLLVLWPWRVFDVWPVCTNYPQKKKHYRSVFGGSVVSHVAPTPGRVWYKKF